MWIVSSDFAPGNSSNATRGDLHAQPDELKEQNFMHLGCQLWLGPRRLLESEAGDLHTQSNEQVEQVIYKYSTVSKPCPAHGPDKVSLPQEAFPACDMCTKAQWRTEAFWTYVVLSLEQILAKQHAGRFDMMQGSGYSCAWALPVSQIKHQTAFAGWDYAGA